MSSQVVQHFPRGALIGAGALVALAMVSATAARLTGYRQDRPTAGVVAARDLRFDDRPDGSVAVVNAQSGTMVTVLAPGTNGFIRASLRSLARRRQLDGDADRTFHLTAWSDGRLTLDNPEDGNPIELGAFGQTNAMAFAKLLEGAPFR